MTDLYQFLPELILRAPLRPFNPDISETQLAACLEDEGFMEALYLASPTLHEQCGKLLRGELTDPRRLSRVRGSLVRYLIRMRSRCTPFGLFAGCGVLRWGAGSQVELAAQAHRRHTRLDMHYLCALAQHLGEQDFVRTRLRYRPNSSWYRIGEEIRYIEYQYLPTGRVEQISSVEAHAQVEEVLAACNEDEDYGALLARLSPEQTSEREEAAAFLDALIAAQVLVSELEPTVTGPEYFAHLLGVLSRLADQAPEEPRLLFIRQTLTAVADLLAQLDQQPTAPVTSYTRIAGLLEQLGVAPEQDKLFQTDAVLKVNEAGRVDAALQASLLEVVEVLARLAPVPRSPQLEEFKREFQVRYEDEEVPLLQVLDAESGIGYGATGRSSYSPLVHDLTLGGSPAAAAPPAGELPQLLRQKLREAEQLQLYAVDLSPAEVQRLPPAAAPLPASLGVMFRPLTGGRVLLDSVGGSSAVNLLGRFAHAVPEIDGIVRQVARLEQAHNPSVAFAELCHLPGRRLGNILQRPSFRALEIPYLAQSLLPAAEQVPVQDLLLSLRQGQLVLRSRRSGQRIIPLLGTAHNYAGGSLPVYEFLCSLQHEGLQTSLKFNWETVGVTAPFLPRLTYKSVVLEPASWHLPAAEFQVLSTAGAAERASHWQAFRERWRLPRFFTLAEGDNELLVDAENPLLVEAWLESIRGQSTIKLKEFLFEPDSSLARDGEGRPYPSQLIALLVRHAPCYEAKRAWPSAGSVSSAPTRKFSLGSEWLYYKLYCGPKMANRVLREAVAPLVAELEKRKLINHWFFVRYADPDSHLRLRLHLPQVKRLGEVVQLVRDYLQPCLDYGYVWKKQTDTYNRELERYGPSTIELSEHLFHQQSQAYLDYLVAAGPEDEARCWLWGVRAVDELLEAFNLPLDNKLELLRSLKAAFAAEFQLGKELKRQLDAKYREWRPDLSQALTRDFPAAAPDGQLQALAAAIRGKLREHPPEVALGSLLSSYVHMLLNRVIPADARLHELVLYDFLFRHYDSCRARQAR
ncbi:lantibiotic dehydratase [Hymenobacter latericus]|uniref:lantibiotic dehydratase n=1 Tax=Hymenobacter sp. YIM 151858-1 TaxID=2987688 RepID=UPI0022263049|nr:lantibiotic dehydratase [Hymenobacter sp. YIM 151858-1]UYZ61178.1 lantibiotic dehydratase [Hymenobacter sp. YIM 151858-1]